jgi:virulence-associated protein VapD
VQGSLYVSNNEDLAKRFSALMALRNLPWFPSAVRDIRAFRVEQWSDFTQLVKGAPSNTGS